MPLLCFGFTFAEIEFIPHDRRTWNRAFGEGLSSIRLNCVLLSLTVLVLVLALQSTTAVPVTHADVAVKIEEPAPSDSVTKITTTPTTSSSSANASADPSLFRCDICHTTFFSQSALYSH